MLLILWLKMSQIWPTSSRWILSFLTYLRTYKAVWMTGNFIRFTVRPCNKMFFSGSRSTILRSFDALSSLHVCLQTLDFHSWHSSLGFPVAVFLSVFGIKVTGTRVSSIWVDYCPVQEHYHRLLVSTLLSIGGCFDMNTQDLFWTVLLWFKSFEPATCVQSTWFRGAVSTAGI